MSRVVERALTDVEYGVIVSSIDSAPTVVEALIDAVKGTFNALMSDVGKTFDGEERIDPKEWAIPEDQWKSLLGALQERAEREGDSHEEIVGLGLQWMNYGPSGFAG